jgi:hypothetical protein
MQKKFLPNTAQKQESKTAAAEIPSPLARTAAPLFPACAGAGGRVVGALPFPKRT